MKTLRKIFLIKVFVAWLMVVKFAKLMGDDMNFEIFIFVFVNPFFSVFFYKLKTWHETEIECHDSLSNQSSSIFKVEIGIFFTTISFLVSFLSTHQKIIDLNQDDHHYITWQLSKKHQSLQKSDIV